MPDNPDAVTGSVSRDDEQGTQTGTRDEIALLTIIFGVALVLTGVAFQFGWKYTVIVGGSLVFVAGALLGFGGDE